MKDDSLLAPAGGNAPQRAAGPAADIRFFMNSLIQMIGGGKQEVGGSIVVVAGCK